MSKYYKTICHFTKVFQDGRSLVVWESSSGECSIQLHSYTIEGHKENDSSKEEFEQAFERVMSKQMEEALR